MYKPPNYVLHWRHHILEWKYPESYTLHSEKTIKNSYFFYSLKIVKKHVLKCKKHVLKCTNHPTMFGLLKTPYFGMKISWKLHVAQWKNNKKPPHFTV